jgi:hypothetical protein
VLWITGLWLGLCAIKSGVSLGRYPRKCDLRTVSSSSGAHVALCDGAQAPELLCSGPPRGKLSGGNWMVVRCLTRSVSRASIRCSAPSGALPSVNNSTLAGRGSASALPLKIVTWLILPVVICLSQRLSHACLSISNLYCETANGSLNQLSFI